MSDWIPDWYALVLLSLASWRVFQLIGQDEILDRPRRWALRLGGDWQKDGDPVPEGYRVKWGLFITCPYCAGFWIAVAWWIAWQLLGEWATFVAVPFAMSAAVIGAAKILSMDE